MRFATAVQRSAGKRREVYLDEFGRTFPALYSWRRRRKERKDVIVGRPRLNWLSSLGSTSRYAPRAKDLVLQMPERFDPTKVKGWEGVVGLHLLKDRGVPEEKFTLRIGGDRLEVVEGELPENALVTLRMQAGVWAAIASAAKPPVECPARVTARWPTSWRMAAVSTRAIISAVSASDRKPGGKTAG